MQRKPGESGVLKAKGGKDFKEEEINCNVPLKSRFKNYNSALERKRYCFEFTKSFNVVGYRKLLELILVLIYPDLTGICTVLLHSYTITYELLTALYSSKAYYLLSCFYVKEEKNFRLLIFNISISHNAKSISPIKIPC